MSQYVVFKMGQGEYGIDIMNVQEITDFREITNLPGGANYLEGIIHIRGVVIPIINLKKKLKLEETAINQTSKIIITSIAGNQIGFIVDDASQVMTLKESEIHPPPEIVNVIEEKFITGIAHVNKKIIILIDLHPVFTEDELNNLKKVG